MNYKILEEITVKSQEELDNIPLDYKGKIYIEFGTYFDKAVEECFRELFKQCKDFNRTICLPYKYGCGIANGKWNKILNIIENLSNEIGIDVNIYRLEEI